MEGRVYMIYGQKIEGLLGKRLDEIRPMLGKQLEDEICITGIPCLEGIVVFTDQGTFYSEISLPGPREPIPIKELGEYNRRIIKTVTIEAAGEGKNNFEVSYLLKI